MKETKQIPREYDTIRENLEEFERIRENPRDFENNLRESGRIINSTQRELERI